MNRFPTEWSQKLFCKLYGRKKEFDIFVILCINRDIAMLFIIRYEGKCQNQGFNCFALNQEKSDGHGSRICAFDGSNKIINYPNENHIREKRKLILKESKV